MARGAKKHAFLSANPFCIYCGGDVRSTTWDHMPNKGMFPKDRPGGLEFPSCEECNHGSKWFEDIASFLGSIQLGTDGDEIADSHFAKKLSHLQRCHPDVLAELKPSYRQMRKRGNWLSLTTE